MQPHHDRTLHSVMRTPAPCSTVGTGACHCSYPKHAARSRVAELALTDRVLVQSMLLGIVGFGDVIPADRCSADSALPRIGRLGTFRRPRLEREMP